MSLRKQLALTIVVTFFALLIWASPDARTQFGVLSNIVQANGLLVLLIITPVLLVLTAAIFIISYNAKNRSRDLDEYMRVARQSKPLTPKPDSLPIDIKEEANLPLVDTVHIGPAVGKPVLSVIAGGKSDFSSEASEVAIASAEIEAVAEHDLSFQAVIYAETNDIVGYEVLLRQSSDKQTKPIYVRTPRASTAGVRAALEYQVINQALRSQRQIIAASDATNARLFMNVSPSILSDKNIWTQLVWLLSAHRELASSLTVIFSDAHLLLTNENGNDQKTAERLSELRKMRQLGTQIGIRGALGPISKLSGKMLRLVQLISFDVMELGAGDFSKSIQNIEAKSGKGAFDLYCTNMTSAADIIDALAGHVSIISGDHLAPPRALKTDATIYSGIETSNVS